MMGAGAVLCANLKETRGVRRIASADYHHGIHLLCKLDGGKLALRRRKADGVFHLKVKMEPFERI